MEAMRSKEKITDEQKEVLRLIGEQIMRRRRRLRISQREMAERLSISTSHLSNIESGKTNVSLSIFLQILFVLSLSPSDIEELVMSSRIYIPAEKGRLLAGISSGDRSSS
ncbi:MAG: helix-turn-helix transcriptional regulator [Catonella sp.]|nr:helix-turn-helix transcriptional regulator [Catonella sp.]MDY6357656.1 helix-turn-helix transcriptional regulator [Catonella sp.]